MSTLTREGVKYITRSVLRERGWTPKMIESLLGSPDHVTADPYGYGSRTPLWSLKRIEAIESSQAWRPSCQQDASCEVRHRPARAMWTA